VSILAVGLLAGTLLTLGVRPAAAADEVPGGGRANAGAHDARPTRTDATIQAAPPPGYTVLGIDVSSHDHSTFPTIDWAGQVNSGISFAYIKATEAQNYTNPYFANDYRDAKAAGLYVGAYTFGRPDKRDPVGDANFFIDRASFTNDSKTLVPFLDMEWPYFSIGTCYGLTQTEMRAWVQAFLDQVKVRIGRDAMIYTAASWWNQCVGTTTSFGRYPLDVANYNVTSPTLPYGWTTWTVWQYAGGNNSQQGNYDKDVFNGDLEGLKRLAGIDPPPPLVASPAAIVHSSVNQVEVYGNASGALVERYWSTSFGWSGWSNFGGGISGTPYVFQNPKAGTVEVYANVGGHVAYKYWLSGRWANWIDLGGSIVGDPVVFYSPVYGSTEIYARGSNNHLMQKYYAGAWSGWNDLGGDLAGDPALLYNPRFRSTEIYARGSNSHLAQKYYAGGWSGWNDLGGDLAGDPALFLSPLYGTTEVYARAPDGHLAQKYYSSAWSDWYNLGGTLGGDPVILYVSATSSTQIYANGGGTLVQLYYLPGSGWSSWNDLGGAISSDPAAVVNSYTGNTEVYAVSAGNLVTNVDVGSSSAWTGWRSLMQ
jgi:GH25 family lysozyme M1 (1,4-beta-N-acetylmuramidase)